MKKLGQGVVNIADLNLSRALIAERRDTENVRDLAADRKKWGEYLHDPVVRRADGRLVTGRDRAIGAIVAGDKRLTVQWVECTDEEAEELELVENVHRRSDPDEVRAQRQAYLDLMERRYAAEPEVERGPGRPKTARAKAREDLAKKEGVTPAAFRMQERRQEEREAHWGYEEGDREEVLGPSIQTFGLEVPPTIDARARRVQAAVDQADTHLRALAALVNGLEEMGASAHDAQRAKQEYERVSHCIRSLRPQALCPRCKGRVAVEKCLMCMGTGFATKAKMGEDIPPQLLQEGEKAMVGDERGGFRLLTGGPSVPPKVGLGGKRLTTVVVDENGNEMAVDPETGEPLAF